MKTLHHTDLGTTFTEEEVFVYWNGPVLYTARTEKGRLYLILWASAPGERFLSLPEPYIAPSDLWWCLPVSEARMAQLKARQMDLYTAFRNPEWDGVVFLVEATEPSLTWAIGAEGIALEDLPDPGSFLIEEA